MKGGRLCYHIPALLGASLLGVSDSDLQDFWNEHCENLAVELMGIISNDKKDEVLINTVIFDLYAYVLYNDQYTNCLEIILLNPSFNEFGKGAHVVFSGILQRYERVRNSETQFGCNSILRIHVEDSSLRSAQVSIDYGW